MLVDITSVEVREDAVIYKGTNIESVLTGDLYTPMKKLNVTLVFEREQGPMNYLIAMCKSKGKGKDKGWDSYGEMFESLLGVTVNVAPAFLKKK